MKENKHSVPSQELALSFYKHAIDITSLEEILNQLFKMALWNVNVTDG